MKISASAVLLFLVCFSLAKGHFHHHTHSDHAKSAGKGPYHKCVHDHKFKDQKLEVQGPESREYAARRRLQVDPDVGLTGGTSSGTTGASAVDGWHPLRITVDYAQSNALVRADTSLTARYTQSVRLVESVRLYFQTYLNVNYYSMFTYGGGTCYSNRVNSFRLNADLFITIKAENDPTTSYFAAATACVLSDRDSRPTIGAYILNLAFISVSPLNEYLYFSTFAHEFTHILGFSDNLFSRYRDASGAVRGINGVRGTTTIGSETFNTIIIPEVLNYAKSYFSCNAITGIPLENNGGSGSASSHWEKLFLPIEYMNPTVENPGIISEFTMRLLASSNWYQVNAGAAQPYDWGLNVGCGHFQICPVGSQGNCAVSQVGQSICSSEWMSKGVCTQERTFSSGCPIKRSLVNSCVLSGSATLVDNTEVYGSGSRCINYRSGNYYQPKCHRVACNGNTLTITVGSRTATCTTSGQLVNVGTSYSLECPNISDFCNEFAKRCPDDCSAQGICLTGGRCQCFYGFSGTNCGTNNRGATGSGSTTTGTGGTTTGGSGTTTGNTGTGSTGTPNMGTGSGGTVDTGSSSGDVGVNTPDTTGDDGYVAPTKTTSSKLLKWACASILSAILVLA